MRSLEDAERRIRTDIHRLQKDEVGESKGATYFILERLLGDLNTNSRAQERHKTLKVNLERTYNTAIAYAKDLKAKTYALSSREKHGQYAALNQKHKEQKAAIFS